VTIFIYQMGFQRACYFHKDVIKVVHHLPPCFSWLLWRPWIYSL